MIVERVGMVIGVDGIPRDGSTLSFFPCKASLYTIGMVEEESWMPLC